MSRARRRKSLAEVFSNSIAAAGLGSTRYRHGTLVADMERNFPTLDGWTWEYEYPGYFCYHRDRVRVYFTPDFDKLGEIDIQVGEPRNGINMENAVRYNLPLTAAYLVGIVRPYLGRAAERFGLAAPAPARDKALAYALDIDLD